MQIPDWDRLDERVRHVLGWAVASEPAGRIGSRGLLIGILRADLPDNEPDQLLRHFAVTRAALYRCLQDVRPTPAIRPDAPEPSTLSDYPRLTPNAQRVIEKADDLSSGRVIDVRHLFGGILEMPQSTAYEGLKKVVEGEAVFDRVAKTYPEYVGTPGESYAVFLRRRCAFTGRGAGAAADRSTEDQLGFEHYVAAFAELIQSRSTAPPLTIGIYGAWGTGKSFLLGAIVERIKNSQKGRSTRTRVAWKKRRRGDHPHDLPPMVQIVEFNAWEYSASKVIWPGLVRRIMTELDRARPFYVRGWRRLRRNLLRQLRVERASIIGGTAVLAGAAVIASQQKKFDTQVLLAGIATLGVGGLVKLAFDTLADPLGQWFGALFEDRRYGSPIGYMAEIREDLDRLQKRLHGDRVLVIIDDLDRCEPDKAVEVLQAVNLLLGFDTFIVCLGIDARVVTQAINLHYRDLLAGAGTSGYEYLDKIVQIPFLIPKPTPKDIETFLDRQLPRVEKSIERKRSRRDRVVRAVLRRVGRAPTPPRAAPSVGAPPPGEPDGQDARDAEQTEVDRAPTGRFTDRELQAFTKLTPFLRPNPRHLKRLVNVYGLVRSLDAAQSPPILAGRPAGTVRWLTIAAQWPYAASRMLRRFVELDDELGERTEGPDVVVAGRDPLLHLYDEVKSRLTKQQRRRYDGDEDDTDLVKLLESGQGEISWTDLKALRAYTVNFNPAVEEDFDDQQPSARSDGTSGANREASPVLAVAKPVPPPPSKRGVWRAGDQKGTQPWTRRTSWTD
jgi:KAP family P-loop domain